MRLTQPSLGRTLQAPLCATVPWRHNPSTYEVNVIARSCRDVELAKFEAFLAKQGGYDVNAMVRGRQELAYPIRKCAFTTPE